MDIIWVKVRDMVTHPEHTFMESDLDSVKPAILECVGFLIREDDNDLVIAGTRCDEDKAVREVMAIPKETIRERKKLFFDGKRLKEEVK